MILLTSTSDKLQLITSAAATIDVHASWVETSATGIVPGRTNTNISTATTTDVVVAPAAATQRNVKTLHVRNKDSVTCDVTVQHTDGTRTVQLHKVTALPAGAALEYIDEVGFQVIGAAGQTIIKN
jgi:hypothetical protein